MVTNVTSNQGKGGRTAINHVAEEINSHYTKAAANSVTGGIFRKRKNAIIKKSIRR